MAAVAGGSRTLTNPSGAAERVPGQAVTTAFFDVLGITPLAGRTFVSGDMSPQQAVVVISERFWRSHLAADPAAVGEVLRLDGQAFTVIGIVPASFQILYPADSGRPSPCAARLNSVASITFR